jgi:hypothetical protein
MKNLTLKKEFTNRVVERKSPISGSMIRADFNKVEEKDYIKYFKIGFQDCFTYELNEKKSVPVEVIKTKITVEVDNLNDLTMAELKDQAKTKGIDFKGNISKAKLIDLLNGKA